MRGSPALITGPRVSEIRRHSLGSALNCSCLSRGSVFNGQIDISSEYLEALRRQKRPEFHLLTLRLSSPCFFFFCPPSFYFIDIYFVYI